MFDLPSEDEFLARAAAVPVQYLDWQLPKTKGVEVFVRRDDLVDSRCSGNKFYKLFYNLCAAKNAGYTRILSFGGAWSNHLYTLAAAGTHYGFETIGVVRGERPTQLSNTLADAEGFGMKLEFVSRENYRGGMTPELQVQLLRKYGDFFAIPEGGANKFGTQGAKILGRAISEQAGADYTSVCLACGTGSTLAGLALGLAENSDTIVTGFSVLKGEGGLGGNILMQQRQLSTSSSNWRLISGYHGGGYAKKLPGNLRDFERAFTQETGLLLDPVYTVKMFWGVARLLLQNYWPSGSRLLLVHTGGLQGRRGFDLD